MKFQKIIGWITFFTGILIIGFTLYHSYNIFTGKIPSPEIFKIQTKDTTYSKNNTSTTSSKNNTSTTSKEIQREAREIFSEQLKEILPQDILTKTLNLIVWSIFAGILIFGGGQISSLGIKLIK
jgi:hypothetical protein